MKIGNNIPKTLIRLCEQDGRVTVICNEGKDGYWLTLIEGCTWCDCGSVHEYTISDCKDALRAVKPQRTAKKVLGPSTSCKPGKNHSVDIGSGVCSICGKQIRKPDPKRLAGFMAMAQQVTKQVDF